MFLKRLRCKHENKLYSRVYTDRLMNGKYIAHDICRCSKCGKVIYDKIKYLPS